MTQTGKVTVVGAGFYGSTTAQRLADTAQALRGEPGGLAWIGHRLIWLPVFAAVLAGLWALVRRFEAPWPPGHRAAKTLIALAAAGFAAYALAVI